MSVTVNLGPIVLLDEVSVAAEQWRLSQWKDPQPPITLTAGIGAAAVNFTVSDATAINNNDQLFIDQEAINVTSKAGNVVTGTRGATITTPAAHAANSVVHICALPSAVALFRLLLREALSRFVLANRKPASIELLEAEIAARQESIRIFHANLMS